MQSKESLTMLAAALADSAASFHPSKAQISTRPLKTLASSIKLWSVLLGG